MKVSPAFIHIFRILRERDRFWILFSILIERVGSFLLLAIISRALTPYSFGELTTIRTITSIAQPLAGGGGQYSLLHFGAKHHNIDEKSSLAAVTLSTGLLFSLFPIVGLIVWNTFTPTPFSLDAQTAFWIAISAVVTYNVFEIIKNYYRIIGNNRHYAILGIAYTFLLLLLGWQLSNQGIIGFAILLAIIPLAIAIPDLISLLLTSHTKISTNISFWRYGFYVGAGSVINQLFVSMDIIILFFLDIDPALIAVYKIATIIPYSLFFLPGAFLTADFVYLSHHAKNKKTLQNYLRSYFALFGSLTFFLILFLYTFSEPLITLCFGDLYPHAADIQNIFLIGLASSFMLRIPFGNLLHALGKADWNVLHAIVLTPISAIVLYLAVKWKGIEGAALASSGMLFLSGLLCMGLFWYYLQKLSNDETHAQGLD